MEEPKGAAWGYQWGHQPERVKLGGIPLRYVRYDFLSKEVGWRRNEWMTLLTLTTASSRSSSASSAEALAPVSASQDGQVSGDGRGRLRPASLRVRH